MPSVFQYIPPTDSRRSRFSTLVSGEYARREKEYALALRYYRGEHDAQLVVEDEDDVDDNVFINLVKLAGDRTASFLFPKGVEFITDQAAVEKTEHELFLDDFVRASGGLKTLIKWALRGFLAGHTFIQVVDADPMPRMIVADPLSITVFWRADDQADVVWYESRYIVAGMTHIRDFVRSSPDKWMIYDYQQKDEAASRLGRDINEFTHHGRLDTIMNNDGEGLSYKLVKKTPFTHPHGPLLDTPHLPDPDSYYGMGEGREKTLQDTINRLASIRNQIARENAEPVDFLAGADASSIESGGGILSHPSPDARPYRLEMKGDLAGITSSIDRLVETYLALVRVVLLKGEAKDLQRVTNASVRTLFLDALAKNGILRSAYGDTLRKAADIALMMGYKRGLVSNPAGIKVTVDWPSPLPEDMTEIANMIALAQSGGYMSRKTAAEMVGLDWGREQAGIKEDNASDMLDKKQTLTIEAEAANMNNEKDVNGTLASAK